MLIAVLLYLIKDPLRFSSRLRRSSLAPGSQPNPRVRNQHLRAEMALCENFPAHFTSLLQRAAGRFFPPLSFRCHVGIKDAFTKILREISE
ncbi:hypothetical protein CEXT_292631 [Caerostris extrusa]|uniref:Uncharacterized protein n=1 Tax=Caerostris extrusa TaxID=172846 RepID=A0AAV4W9E0_CAEEX|nr:hypothetical protein CEXT_292631 [Caerostris extrusa]